MKSYKDLVAYQKGYKLALEIKLYRPGGVNPRGGYNLIVDSS